MTSRFSFVAGCSLAIGCALFSSVAQAQITPPVAAQPTASTTILALHQAPLPATSLHLPTAPLDERRDAGERLFSRRRTGGIVWSVIGGAIFVRAVASGIASDQFAGGFLGGAIFGGIPLAIGLGKLNRFSKEREHEAMGAYDNMGTFPAYVEKRLD